MIVLRVLGPATTRHGEPVLRIGITVGGRPFHSQAGPPDDVLAAVEPALRDALALQETLPTPAPDVAGLRDAIEEIREAAIQEGANDTVAAAIAHACLVARLHEDEPS